MNGVMRASVSAGSSQRETRVTCTPMARVPSGGAAKAGDRPAPKIPQTRPKIRTAAMLQHEERVMTPPKEYSRCAASGLAFAGANAVRRLAQVVIGHITLLVEGRSGEEGEHASEIETGSGMGDRALPPARRRPCRPRGRADQ